MHAIRNDIVLHRSYENCRCLGVAILDMQINKFPLIYGYDLHQNAPSLP